jgi:hypothetical protein
MPALISILTMKALKFSSTEAKALIQTATHHLCLGDYQQTPF